MTKDSKAIVAFLFVTFAASWATMGFVIHLGGISHAGAIILGVMWIPGLASLLIRAVLRTGYADIGWKPGSIKFHAIAFLVPLVVACITYAISWGAGISESIAPSAESLARMGVKSQSLLFFKIYPIIFVVGALAALGEELGWRGFLIPKLYRTPVRYPLLISALIWGIWHLPLIFWGGYATSDLPLVSAALFMVMILAAGAFVGWLRMQSGSVWVAVMYHAAHNFFLQTAFENFDKPGPLSPILVGESGVIPCLTYLTVLGLGFLWMSSRAALPTKQYQLNEA